MDPNSVQPMSLGDHLEELRKRLVWVLILFFIFLVLGFVFRVELRAVFEGPLRVAAEAVGEEVRKKIRMPDPDGPMLSVLGIEEGPINDLKITILFAFMLSMPVLLYQACRFVMPGLTTREQKAAFWMVPAAVIFFYGGVIFGYFIGIPLLYEILIEYSEGSNRAMDLRESEYLRFFTLMTLSFGLVMDIPWAILVLVKAGIVSPQQLAQKRKIILVGAVVAAAVLTPPDPMSQMFLFVMIVGLFESGLLVSRFIGNNKAQQDHVTATTDDHRAIQSSATQPSSDSDSLPGEGAKADINADSEQHLTADHTDYEERYQTRHETVPDDQLADEEDWDEEEGDDDGPIARPRSRLSDDDNDNEQTEGRHHES